MKPGIETSEFWVTIVGTIIISLGSSLGVVIDQSSSASIAAILVTYIAGRVFHKNITLKNAKNIDDVAPVTLENPKSDL
jgi:uncharacterized membrane protein YfcA